MEIALPRALVARNEGVWWGPGWYEQLREVRAAAMSDIEVSEFHWAKLKKSKNAFLPRLIAVLAPIGGAPTNKQIADAAKMAGVEGLSQHRVGDVMNLKPIRAGTVEHVLKGYLQIVKERDELPPLSEKDIVVAALAIPKLPELMELATTAPAALSEMSGVSLQAVNHAMDGGRVSAGIACALWTALSKSLGDKVPPLGKFAESHTKHGRKSIELVDKESPLSYDDLLLPVLDDHPVPWP